MKDNRPVKTIFIAHAIGFIGMLLLLLNLTIKNTILFAVGFFMIFANRWIVFYRYLEDVKQNNNVEAEKC